MELAIYAHPWDLRALETHGGLARLRDLGFGEVALAVSYHAGRWLTPWHPDGMVRFLEDGVVHFRPRGDYGRLTPKASSEVPASGPSPLESFCEDAAKVGMRTRAWVVCTHNTRLGELHPDCCVQNAFGDRYTYALCPANPDVQHYVRALVGDLATQPGLHAIELESLGWMGHRHNSHHDKSSFAADVWTDLLLSTCFCSACRAQMTKLPFRGQQIDAEAVERRRLQMAAILRQQFMAGDCLGTPPPKLDREALVQRLTSELGEETAIMLSHRFFTLLLLTAEFRKRHGMGVHLALQTNHDALRGGPSLPLMGLGQEYDEAVLTTYAETADGVGAAVASWLQLPPGSQAMPYRPPQLRLALHPRQPQYKSDDDLRKVRDLCTQNGVSAISIYHLGLLPWRTIERVAAILR